MRPVIIASGRCGRGAGFEVLNVPEGINLASVEKNEYRTFLIKVGEKKEAYLSFEDFLVAKMGCSKSDIEEYWPI